MSYIKGVVYDPPSREYPPLIVIFKADGEVLAVRTAPSVEAGEEFLNKVEKGVRASLETRLSDLSLQGK
jgi:hypothetical protein